jgi:hypothetical protein
LTVKTVEHESPRRGGRIVLRHSGTWRSQENSSSKSSPILIGDAQSDSVLSYRFMPAIESGEKCGLGHSEKTECDAQTSARIGE